jgi:CHAD domain-containing protein
MTAPVTCRGTAATPAALLRDLDGAGFRVGPATRITATVLDTFDGRLHGAGLRLEHRGGRLVLTGAGTPAASMPADVVPRFAADLPPGPFRARLGAITEVRAVAEVATVNATTHLAERRNRDGKIVATVSIHDELRAGDAAIGGWLAEVDELTGYDRQAGEAREIVAPHVGEPLEGDALAVILDVAGIDLAGRHVEPGVTLDPDLPAIEGFRLVLANLAEAITVNLPGTIDDIDIEFLHDLRVAVRRTRSVLRHGRDVLAPDLLAWSEPAMRSIGDITSPPRDLDVQVIEWESHMEGLDDASIRAVEPVRRQLVADRNAAHVVLSEQLRGADVGAVLQRWHAALAVAIDPQDAGPGAAEPIGAVVARRIHKAQRQLLDHGRAITPATPAEHVHDVRKDAKKLRYLLECFAGVLPGDGRKAFVKRLKRLQDLLGDHQDAEVQAGRLRTAADELPPNTAPATYVAVGRLVEQLEEVRQTAREGFAERFDDYDSPTTRDALHEMLAGVAP